MFEIPRTDSFVKVQFSGQICLSSGTFSTAGYSRLRLGEDQAGTASRGGI